MFFGLNDCFYANFPVIDSSPRINCYSRLSLDEASCLYRRFREKTGLDLQVMVMKNPLTVVSNQGQVTHDPRAQPQTSLCLFYIHISDYSSTCSGSVYVGYLMVTGTLSSMASKHNHCAVKHLSSDYQSPFLPSVAHDFLHPCHNTLSYKNILVPFLKIMFKIFILIRIQKL